MVSTLEELVATIESEGLNFSSISTSFNRRLRKPEMRWTLLLPGAGCPWRARTRSGVETGRCTFCGFLPEITRLTGRRLFPREEMIAITQGEWERISHLMPKQLMIFNGGNFSNDSEITADSQIGLAEWVAAQPFLDRMIIENRPEFCTKEKISIMVEILRGKKLVVAIGMESQDECVIRENINKGYGRDELVRAVDVLRMCGADVSIYVFHKPVCLTEMAAIDDAVKSIEFAQALDPFEVALEAAIVLPDTIMADRFLDGQYRPPWLWSVVEVIRRAHRFGPLHVGSFTDTPKPLAKPTNYGCNKCNEDLEKLLVQFNQSQDPSDLLAYDCLCKSEWQGQAVV